MELVKTYKGNLVESRKAALYEVYKNALKAGAVKMTVQDAWLYGLDDDQQVYLQITIEYANLAEVGYMSERGAIWSHKNVNGQLKTKKGFKVVDLDFVK